MKKPYFIIYIAMFAAFLWLDRFFKNLVVNHLALGEAWPSGGGFARILYTQNTGVSFSLLAGHPEILIALQSILFVVVAIAFVLTYRRLRHPLLQTALCWIACGGLGNLIDRIRFGYVIDFISVGTFPIWNFADMCIVGGCILLGIYILFVHGNSAKEKEVAGDDR
ncbi:MAG: signal peptidase II [Clostridiales Family XIII bacterium]|nr:signal peptidase II [Clostridiales Family XIII bacterium]